MKPSQQDQVRAAFMAAKVVARRFGHHAINPYCEGLDGLPAFGTPNKRARPGAQMAHIRAARKARNQRRARIAARRGGK